MARIEIRVGDCRDALKALPDESVNCVVTSPPYFGLRDYGVDGQIGLEPTPDAFVAEMVAVFREVRRVLRSDGTLWLNLGDSYSATTKGSSGVGKNATNKGTLITDRSWAIPPGLKPKDLIGIPWRVAFALQQPYFSGRIKRVEDRIWLAAMIDGEGCFYIHRRPAGQHAGGGYHRTQDSYSAAFEVANTHKAIVDRCHEIAGVGSVICQEKDRRQPLYRWTVRASEARALAKEIYPHIVGKRQQCRIICGMPPSGPKAEAAWQAMKLLHAGTETTVDFPEPESCFEQGWYLRQDCIWSKPNPMPESVTDRCTKAHEYLFLMAKSERYFYDAGAIAEASAYPGDERHLRTDRTIEMARPDGGPRARTAKPNGETRNKRSVWAVATAPFSEAHFATFPPALIEPCIKAGCPEGGTVLDPFGGAGTTGLVADRLGRNAILIELNHGYAAMAADRIRADCGMLADVHIAA